MMALIVGWYGMSYQLSDYCQTRYIDIGEAVKRSVGDVIKEILNALREGPTAQTWTNNLKGWRYGNMHAEIIPQPGQKFCVACLDWKSERSCVDVMLERPDMDLRQERHNYSNKKAMTFCLKCYGYATQAAVRLSQRMYDATTKELLIEGGGNRAVNTLYDIRDMRYTRALERREKDEKEDRELENLFHGEGHINPRYLSTGYSDYFGERMTSIRKSDVEGALNEMEVKMKDVFWWRMDTCAACEILYPYVRFAGENDDKARLGDDFTGHTMCQTCIMSVSWLERRQAAAHACGMGPFWRRIICKLFKLQNREGTLRRYLKHHQKEMYDKVKYEHQLDDKGEETSARSVAVILMSIELQVPTVFGPNANPLGKDALKMGLKEFLMSCVICEMIHEKATSTLISFTPWWVKGKRKWFCKDCAEETLKCAYVLGAQLYDGYTYKGLTKYAPERALLEMDFLIHKRQLAIWATKKYEDKVHRRVREEEQEPQN
jgi:hypothetical protein